MSISYILQYLSIFIRIFDVLSDEFNPFQGVGYTNIRWTSWCNTWMFQCFFLWCLRIIIKRILSSSWKDKENYSCFAVQDEYKMLLSNGQCKFQSSLLLAVGIRIHWWFNIHASERYISYLKREQQKIPNSLLILCGYKYLVIAILSILRECTF